MGSQTYSFHLDALHCGACAARAEAALHQVPSVERAEVNLATASLSLTLAEHADLADALAALERAGTPAKQDVLTFDIPTMHCGGCAARVERALAELPFVLSASANLATKQATVNVLSDDLAAAEVAAHLTKAGYPPLQKVDDTPVTDDESVVLKRDTVIAALLSLPVVVFEMGAHIVPAFHHWIHLQLGQTTSWALQFVLTTLVLLWPGQRFFRLGLPALLRRAPDMNALVALGTSAAWGFSTIALFFPQWLPDGTRAVYFEAAAVIVTLILLGRTLEARVKGRTGAAIRKLLDLRPKTAMVIEDALLEERPIAALRVGDLLRVVPGATIPTDGTVAEGEGFVEEAMLTGEPNAVAKCPGDKVTGGTLNGHQALDIRVTAVGEATTLAQIIRMVSDAQSARLPIQQLVNQITLWFVPAVMTVAALTVITWLAVGPSPALGYALVAGVSVLIIACPCAMGLATPTSIMVGIGRAAALGVLFRKGDALQSLTGARVIAFDKTGTLTEGRPSVTGMRVSQDADQRHVLQIAATAEARSEHPIARAVLDYASAKGVTPLADAQVTTIPGFGLEGSIDGQRIFIGAERLMARGGFTIPADLRVEDGATPVYLALDGQVVASFTVADRIKAGARAAVDALQQSGREVAMITGDSTGSARAVADRLGISTVIADVLPDQKAEAVKRLQKKGPVAFVGDGINDAPALATADIGIAIGTGTDVAIEAADVVLMSGALDGVVSAFEVSRRTLANIRQNLGWAFGYNVLLIPVAAGALYPVFGILLSPMLAAAAMTVSSLFVLGNALRLRRIAGRAPVAAPPSIPLKEVNA